MLTFCTLFDSNYLDKGLVLYNSMKECMEKFRLYILAMDEKCREILKEMNLSNVVVISLQEFEDEEMVNICTECVESSIDVGQSIEQGILAWYQFVIERLKDAPPCIICFSFLEKGQVPSRKCSTCGNKFHKQCLSKWFGRCQHPTCPYCGSVWRD